MVHVLYRFLKLGKATKVTGIFRNLRVQQILSGNLNPLNLFLIKVLEELILLRHLALRYSFWRSNAYA